MMVVEDNETVYSSMSSLMENSDDKEDLNEVTLLDLQKDLETLPINRSRKLDSLLIDFSNELTSQNLMTNKMLSRQV